ncbi:MAG TPA: hypothetical protein PK916_08970 [Bacteroidota bacterium]|nr:hypothetical protein [Bacteroidota bacterium]
MLSKMKPLPPTFEYLVLKSLDYANAYKIIHVWPDVESVEDLASLLWADVQNYIERHGFPSVDFTIEDVEKALREKVEHDRAAAEAEANRPPLYDIECTDPVNGEIGYVVVGGGPFEHNVEWPARDDTGLPRARYNTPEEAEALAGKVRNTFPNLEFRVVPV